MFKITDISQIGEKVTHDIDYCIHTAGTLVTVFYRNGMLDHVLNIAPILGHNQFVL
jgi:hypothetical protein